MGHEFQECLSHSYDYEEPAKGNKWNPIFNWFEYHSICLWLIGHSLLRYRLTTPFVDTIVQLLP
jgi:hypothetical protein